MFPSLFCSISTAVREVPTKKLEPSLFVSKVWLSVLEESEESANKSSSEFWSTNKVLVFVAPGNVVIELAVV